MGTALCKNPKKQYEREGLAMDYSELETRLKKRIRKRRIIEGILCFAFLVIAIVFAIAYEKSMVDEVSDFGFVRYHTITYNTSFIVGVYIGFVGLALCVVTLICDIAFTKLASIDLGDCVLTCYNGIGRYEFYIDGELKSKFYFASYTEIPLPDGTILTASVNKWHVHLSFSNGRAAIDIK